MVHGKLLTCYCRVELQTLIEWRFGVRIGKQSLEPATPKLTCARRCVIAAVWKLTIIECLDNSQHLLNIWRQLDRM